MLTTFRGCFLAERCVVAPVKTSPVFKIARVLVRRDHVALTDLTHFRTFPRLARVPGRDEYQRQTRRIPFASKYRALPLGVTRKNHTWDIRHLARSIRDVGSGGRRESVAGARRLSSTLS